jgi:hypothetical protein
MRMPKVPTGEVARIVPYHIVFDAAVSRLIPSWTALLGDPATVPLIGLTTGEKLIKNHRFEIIEAAS